MAPSNEEIMAKLMSVHEDTKDIKNRLFGNGQPGLIRTVDAHSRWIKGRVWFDRVLIVTAIGVVTPGIVAGALYLIRSTGN